MRAAQSQASTAANTASSTGAGLESEGQAIQSSVVPKLEAETTAQHSMSPDQLNQLLTAAGAGAGGATGALEGRAELESASTHNSAALPATLDSLARGKQKALASANEGIAAEDVSGALANRQAALGQLGQMGETDTSDALKSMGLQTADINAETEAGKSGWMQNLTNLVGAVSGAKKGPMSYV
jgi:hypothetical protein